MIKKCEYINCGKEFYLNRKDKRYCCRKHKEFQKDIRKFGSLAARIDYNIRGRIRPLIKKLYCENYGFVPIDVCQLDIHHIDGNNNNCLSALLK